MNLTLGPHKLPTPLHPLDQKPKIHRERAILQLLIFHTLRPSLPHSMQLFNPHHTQLNLLPRVRLKQLLNLLVRNRVRNNVEVLIMRFPRLKRRSNEESSEVVEVREVGLSRGVANDVESVVSVLERRRILCPGTLCLLSILVVEVAAADHGEAHFAGADGGVDDSLLVGSAGMLIAGMKELGRGTTHSFFWFHAGCM